MGTLHDVSMWCWKMKPWPIALFPDGIALCFIIWWYFLCSYYSSSNCDKIPTTLVKMKLQTMTVSTVFYGCQHSLLYLSMTFSINNENYMMWKFDSFQFLYNLAYLRLFFLFCFCSEVLSNLFCFTSLRTVSWQSRFQWLGLHVVTSLLSSYHFVSKRHRF